MNIALFETLHAGGIISDTSFEKIKSKGQRPLLSVHDEVKAFLYLGVILLSGGLGTLVYKNIDTIGHQFVLLFLALVSVSCFIYNFKRRPSFTTGKVINTDSFSDYTLLLACVTFISFVGYLQYQYQVFGNRYGAATFLPMIVLFVSAYYFDHLGILSMAITSFAAWLGITVTPLHLLQSSDFNNTRIIFTGLFIGGLLLVVGRATEIRNFKRHFAFTYYNFGIHVFLISCLSALFHFDSIALAWFFVLLAGCYLFYRKSILEHSFYFLLVVTLYAYIGASYMVLQFLMRLSDGTGVIYLGFLYFIASAIGMVYFLVHTNKQFRK